MITKAHLEAKLADFTRQRDQIAANLNAIAGAIETLNVLIAECAQPEAPPETSQETP
jgi:hypothetical protein